MYAITTYELCSTDSIPAAGYSIAGLFPIASQPASKVTVTDSRGGDWTHTSAAAPNPARAMETIQHSRQFAMTGSAVRVVVEVDIPDPQFTSAGYVAITFNGAPGKRTRPTVNGVDLRCIQTTEPPDVGLRWIGISRLEDWLFHAEMLDDAYRDRDGCRRRGLSRFGSDCVVVDRPITANFGSGAMVFSRGTSAVMYIPGTTRASQLVNQGIAMAYGPRFAAIVPGRTMDLWVDGFLESRAALLEACPGCKSVVIVGHSMGGAVGTILAENMHRHGLARPVRLLTYGTPKVGDAEFRKSLDARITERIQLANVGDPIPYLFPGREDAPAWLFNVLTLGTTWQEWRDMGGWYAIEEDGRITPGDLPAPDVAALDLIVRNAVNGVPPPRIAAHYMPTYVERLRQAVRVADV